MKLAIMQPYFLPYIGYFSLIQAADQFILFDTVQFQRKSWMTRNRILNVNGGSTYIHLPVNKAPLDTTIKDILINYDLNWEGKLLSQLLVYKKAPYYKETIDVLEKALNKQAKTLTDVNKHLLEEICQYLQINCEIKVFSEMNLEIDDVNAADEWALNISRKLHATEYINAPGGIHFFEAEKYEKHKIQLTFINNQLTPYKQFHFDFIPGLSIVDVMMFNSVSEIQEMIASYEVINPHVITEGSMT